MTWQVPVLIFSLVWSIASFIWMRRLDPPLRDDEARRMAKISLPVCVSLAFATVSLLF